jgi:hypothetical protein
VVNNYYVWKRNDGYVGATKYMPRGWRQADDGSEVTFQLIGSFVDWPDARDCVQANREQEAQHANQ